MKPSVPYLLLFALAFSCSACSQDDTTARLVKRHQYTLGRNTILLQETVFAADNPLQLVQLHSNETTADSVARTFSDSLRINYLQVANGRQRLIAFTVPGSRRIRFDPNRMFSDAGLSANLRLYEAYTSTAVEQVSGFRNFVLSKLQRHKTVVAVHNNTAGGFSLLHYQQTGNSRVHRNAALDVDDFFLTTDSSLFEKLRQSNVNVVLEDDAYKADDGSLSHYCRRNGIRYVNVEAKHGHAEQQAAMLRTLLAVLRQEILR